MASSGGLTRPRPGSTSPAARGGRKGRGPFLPPRHERAPYDLRPLMTPSVQQTPGHRDAGAVVPPDIYDPAVNALRFLAVDAVNRANSGHPGPPLDIAPVIYRLYTRHLRHDPADPGWFDRDRFVLSGGHASMVLYGALHLAGYDLSLEDLESFRQLGS